MPLLRLAGRLFLYVAVFTGVMLMAAFAVLTIYKEEVLAKVNEKLAESFSGEIKIADYHVTLLRRFPHLTVSLDDIHLRDPGFDRHKRDFLHAKTVRVNISVTALLTGEVHIRSIDVNEGEIFVFRSKSGYTNTQLFRNPRGTRRASETQLAAVELHQVNLKNVNLLYQDSLGGKHLGLFCDLASLAVSASNDTLRIESSGKVKFLGLTFNPQKGAFLRDIDAQIAVNMGLDSTMSNLRIYPSTVSFHKTAATLAGNFQLDSLKQFALRITSDNADHNEALNIVHDTLAHKLSAFTVDVPIAVAVDIQGRMLSGVKPAVDVSFSFSEGNASAGKITAQRVTLRGAFNNHVNTDVPNNDNNARLDIQQLKAIIEGLPVEASLTLTDMTDPSLYLNAVFDTPLRDLNDNMDSTRIHFKKGHFRSVFTYSGKLKEYLDDSKTEYEGKLSGQATVRDGSLTYNGRQLRLDKVNATFDFDEKVFTISSLSGSVNGSTVSVTGQVTDLIPFFVNPRTTGKVKLAVVSPGVDITGITKPGKSSRRATKEKKRKSRERIADIVDGLNESLDFDVNLSIARFTSGNFKADRLAGRLLLANNKLEIKDLRMTFGGGNVVLNSQVRDVDNPISPISIRATASDVGLKDFFAAFNNFKQKTFTHDKVDGHLTMDIDIQSAINNRIELQLDRLRGETSFAIKGLRLTKFEPIQRLSNFLMKGRDFSDVSFNDIHSAIGMHGSKMNVRRMEVESTVITMFIEGTYDLGDSTDLAVQVPLSNLKKRNQEIAPENIGTDARVGPSVFLRVRTDKDGKTVITYDPFKKFRKKKKGRDT